MDRVFEQRFIQWLWDHGYFWQTDDALNVQQDQLSSLTLSDEVVKQAVRQFQQADGNLDYLSYGLHQRPPVADGDAGPATLALYEHVDRCPLPDVPPPPNAIFHYDDPDLQAAVESMQAAAAGPPMKGAYWRGCDPTRPNVHSLVIGIDARSAPSNFKNNQEHILAERRRMAAEIGVAVRFIVNPSSMEGLQQYQVYRGIAGSTIGMNYFPQRNSCGRIPNGSMSSSYNPSNLALHISLGIHESEGHGFGFNHTKGGIMNPSIIVSPLKWQGDPGWSQVIAHYPGVPLIETVPVPPPTPPGPQPPTPDAWPIIEPFIVTVGGRKYRFNPIPSPQL